MKERKIHFLTFEVSVHGGSNLGELQENPPEQDKVRFKDQDKQERKGKRLV